ncbi:MAG: XRE family transcriptional regulator [Acetobacteraceae bacterium]
MGQQRCRPRRSPTWSDADGVVASDRLTAKLRISKLELAVALGLSRDGRLEDRAAEIAGHAGAAAGRAEIMNRVLPWAGTLTQAFAWYRSQPLASFGDQTAEDLVKEGRAEAVKTYLSRIAVGGYA